MKRRGALSGAFACALLTGLPWSASQVAAHTTPEHDHMKSNSVKVSSADYVLPDIWLVRDDDRRIKLPAELNDGRPVVLNFVYTTCPGICPMMSQVFSQFQERLGAQRSKVHMVSISIDPEQDTPARLRDYAKRFAAGSQWQHYTGSVAASIAAQKAFNAYSGDKMAHDPLTLMRSGPGALWVRLDGFATADDLFIQYTGLTATRKIASAAP